MKTQQQISNMFNQVNYSAENARGSVHDYYHEASYGKLNLVADVVGPYTCDYNSRHYGNHGQGNAQQGSEFATEALRKAVAGGANFAQYDSDNDGAVDCVHIIFAGYGQEAGGGDSVIWSHKWSASERVVNNGKYAQIYSCSPELSGNARNNAQHKISHIGVSCHEIGHVLGAPDFYDTDYGTNGQYPGMGNWDIMAGGSWNGTTGEAGNAPPHHNPYTKAYIYHWVTPVVLSGYDTLTIQPMYRDSNAFYQINTATTNEYYLIANRQKFGFDTTCPGHGLMFYHVHSALRPGSSSVNATHPQQLYPVCATATTRIPVDSASYGNINTNECPYPGQGNRTSFTDFTTPASISWSGLNSNMPIRQITENNGNHTITFIYGNRLSPTCQAPTNLHIDAITDDHVDLSWQNNSSATVWELAYGPLGFDPSTTRGQRLIRDIHTTSYTVSNLSVTDTAYDFYVRAVCGAGDTSAWCLDKATTSIRMPNSGIDSIKACGIHIYDNGGPTVNYSDNIFSILVVKAANIKSKVNIKGVLQREDYDEMYIYDGPDTTGRLLHHVYTRNARGNIVTDSINDTSINGSITIVLIADAYQNAAGFDFLVTCIDTSDCNEQPVPYIEDFGSYASSQATTAGGATPRCWTTYTSNTSASTMAGFTPHVCATSNYSPYASQSNKYLVMAVKRATNASRTYAILPGFDDTITKCKMSFKVRMNSSTASEILQLGYIANFTDTITTDTVFVPLTTIANVTTANGASNQKIVALNQYNIPDTARLAFRWMSTRSTGTSNYYCGIDDVNVTSCEGSSQQDEYCCDSSFTWNLDGNTYRTDTIVSHRISGASFTGCDSIVYLHLTFRQPTMFIDTVRACSTYTWINNVTYTASTDTPVTHLTNLAGCDSLVRLHLTIVHDTNVTDSIVACGPYT
ncbi:MAG: M6 family metalloprotease domain-containing protein, partial [Bacteroidales bacterium]|nr:M6 family metalloprotease domain-containing protein [Bacteroidales bacterium]